MVLGEERLNTSAGSSKLNPGQSSWKPMTNQFPAFDHEALQLNSCVNAASTLSRSLLNNNNEVEESLMEKLY